MTSTDTKDRSQSRGRDAFASSGRGGLGNIRQTSLGRPDSSPAPELVRGRELNAALPTASKVYSTGRGGAGNIRSPSRGQKRDPSQPPTLPPVFDASEEDIMRNHRYLAEEVPISTGRGGVGNINSRSRSRGPALDLIQPNSNPNSNPTTPSKVSLPKDPSVNKSHLRPTEASSNGSMITQGTAPAIAEENSGFAYPPTAYQATGRARED